MFACLVIVDFSFIYIFLIKSFNILFNMFQIALWLILWWKPISMLVILSKMFFAGFSVRVFGFFFYVLGPGVNNQILLIITLIRFRHAFMQGFLCLRPLDFYSMGGGNCLFQFSTAFDVFGLQNETNASGLHNNSDLGISFVCIEKNNILIYIEAMQVLQIYAAFLKW